MRHALWPEEPLELHEREIALYFGADRRHLQHALVAKRGDGGLCGFVELNERGYVDGCDTSPVPYIEGLYVDTDHRRRGIARALIAAAEAWARARGRSELASDCVADNDASLAFHRAAGFEFTRHAVNLRKPLADPPPPSTRLDMIQDDGIVRNRLKIASAVTNAQAFLRVQEEFGSFDAYVWRFVGGSPIVRSPRSLKDVPASAPESDAMSKDLKKRPRGGFRFVGTTICYAFMQAVGMVNDHTVECFRYRELTGGTSSSKVAGGDGHASRPG